MTALVIWLSIGFVVWIWCAWRERPESWHGTNRQPGWGEVLIFYLPACLAIGPILLLFAALSRLRARSCT